MSKMKKEKYDYIINWIYLDLSDLYWCELRDSFKRGFLRERLDEIFGEVDDPYDEFEKLWEGKQHPFILELMNLLDKYKPEFNKIRIS
jgi:hypothetical protein|tara:strand:- start:851 stop:1114 length:264 start_codon:yes stop_codon:yes gene_type:complete